MKMNLWGSFLTALILSASSTAIAKSEGADNSRVNKRDRAKNAVTADQQGNSQRDVEITQKIRQNLVADKELSTYAQNIKVITNNGKVVLKGPVKTAQEKMKAEKIAKTVAGNTAVSNQLSISK